MSTQAQQAPTGVGSTVNDITSMPDIERVVHGFRAALNSLSSESGFQAMAELIDRIPKKDKRIQEMENKLKTVEADVVRMKGDHEYARQVALETYESAKERIDKDNDTLRGEKDVLQRSLKEHENAISDLQGEKEELKNRGRKLEKAYESRGTKLKEKEQELEKLKDQSRKSQDSADDFAKKLNQTRGRVESLEKKVESNRVEINNLKEELQRTDSQLRELEGFSEPLEALNIETFAATLENLWSSATLLVAKFLNQDLSTDTLQDDWIQLHDSSIFKYNIPLPQSNTPIAKQMRIAKVLGVFARLVDLCIFQPTYLCHGKHTFREFMSKLARAEPKKENFLRGMMLSIFPEQQHEGAEDMIDEVITGLLRAGIGELLYGQGVKQFEKELEDVVVQLQKLWHYVQHSTACLLPIFDYADTGDVPWQTLELRTANNTEDAEDSTPILDREAEDPAVIFPRIYLCTDRLQPVTAGTVLWRSQIRAAMRESRKSTADHLLTDSSAPRRAKPTRRKTIRDDQHKPATRTFLHSV